MTVGAYTPITSHAIITIGSVLMYLNIIPENAAVMCHNIIKCKNAVMFHNTIVKHAAVIAPSIIAFKNANNAKNMFARKNADMCLNITTNTFVVKQIAQILAH